MLFCANCVKILERFYFVRFVKALHSVLFYSCVVHVCLKKFFFVRACNVRNEVAVTKRGPDGPCWGARSSGTFRNFTGSRSPWPSVRRNLKCRAFPVRDGNGRQEEPTGR